MYGKANFSDVEICSGDSVTLTAYGGNEYLWENTGETTQEIIVSPTTTTVYNYVVRDGSFIAAILAGCKRDAAPLPFSTENKSIFLDFIFTDDGAGRHRDAKIQAAGAHQTSLSTQKYGFLIQHHPSWHVAD